MSGNVMNDQYGMEDLLEQEKYLIHAYGVYIPEASEPKLRCVLTENLNGCANDQFTVFTKMSEMDWYQSQAAANDQLNTAKQKFSRMQGEMNA